MITLAEALARGLYVSFSPWPYNAGGINCHIGGEGLRGDVLGGRGATPEAALAAAAAKLPAGAGRSPQPAALPGLPGLSTLPGLPGLPKR